MTFELAHSLDSIFPHISNSRRGVLCYLSAVLGKTSQNVAVNYFKGTELKTGFSMMKLMITKEHIVSEIHT